MVPSRKSFLIWILFVFLIAGIFSFQIAASSEKFKLEKSTRPDNLQSLINPRENPEGPSWLGADSATSIRITRDRCVWLFGDTILGKIKDGSRKYSVFIHNTIGVTERNSAGKFGKIKKSYAKEDGKIRAIFPSKKDEVFYWPLVGTTADSSLLVAASKVSTRDAKTFKVLGTTFFRVKNPKDPPKNWTYESQFLPKKNGIVWGTALLKKDDWIYLFGRKGSGLSSKTVLAKIKADDAEKGAWKRKLNFAEGEWKRDSAPKALEGLPGTSETTIQHNSYFGWYCLQIPPFSFEVHLYTAEKITGPWHDQGALYEIPSPWSKKKTKKGKHIFSAYAAKSHPELAEKENEIVLTYNVNLNSFVPGLTDKLGDYIEKEKYRKLYVPQFVSLEFQKEKSG